VKLSTLLRAIEAVGNPATQRVGSDGAASQNFVPPADPEIGSIHYRSQEVKPRGLFVAIEGQAADGHDYIDQALANGACALVVQKPAAAVFSAARAVAVVRVPDTRKALADLAACFYRYPAKQMTLIGITGTNGKTTVAYLVESILAAAGFEVGVISTINCRYAGKTFDNPMTTPESLDLQRILAGMRASGVTHVVMEASSHAMDLYRIRNCWFDAAVFTNLTQDHLDYHGDMHSYWLSKKRLFSEYLQQGPKKTRAAAIVNCDDPRGKELSGILDIPVVKTGAAPDAQITAEAFRCDAMGTFGRVSTPEGSFDFKTPLVGKHNVDNILSAVGAAHALHIDLAAVKKGIEALPGIPGRLERIPDAGGRHVFVDYAHTPDALENAIMALKKIAPARLVCIFGCGGDRDRAKRPLMGEIAGRLCDLTIVTSDNPRTEDPLAIIDQILAGIRYSGAVEYRPGNANGILEKRSFIVEASRRRAIELGIRLARPGDMVLIAGKGHETYQIIGAARIDFDDRREAGKALRTVGRQGGIAN